MKPGSFILNNESSEDYNTFIQERPEIETPRRRVDFKRSFGQSGDNPFDEEAYDNTTMSLVMYVEGSDYRTASDNRDAIYDLFDSGKYLDFIPYFDPNKIYKVMTTDFPTFSPKYFMGEGQPFEVELTVKPYKFYIPDADLVLTAAGTVMNNTSKTALPLIVVYGTGDITLTINGRVFTMKNIVDHVILDCQLMLAYKYVGSVITRQNQNIYTRNYPYLDKGLNEVSWTGTVSKIEIEPRWRTLA